MQIKKLHDYEVVPSMVVSIVRFTIRIARLVYDSSSYQYESEVVWFLFLNRG